MAKLIIDINHSFRAGPMLHNNDDSETVPLTEAQIREMMNDVDEGDFTLMV